MNFIGTVDRSNWIRRMKVSEEKVVVAQQSILILR